LTGQSWQVNTEINFLTVTVTGCPGAPEITSTKLPAARVGQPYTAKLATADNRDGTWSIASGELPGLTISRTSGAIEGTPLTAGTSEFTVAFKDANRMIAREDLRLTVLSDEDGVPGPDPTLIEFAKAYAGAHYSHRFPGAVGDTK
jgi:hypothetical protein